MKIDLSALKQSFLEEAGEQLAVLEHGSLALETSPDDAEQINAIFRAAHSIKGTAGSLGFSQIADFTHVLETLLGRIRNGSTGVSAQQISLLLESVDVLRELLHADCTSDPMPQSARSTMDRLERAAATVCSHPMAVPPGEQSTRRNVRVMLEPAPEFFLTGLDPSLLFRDLAKLGELEAVVADLSRVPSLEDLDPEKCFIAFNTILHTTVGDDRIREVFVFVEETCSVRIAEDLPTPVERRVEPNAAAGEAHAVQVGGSTLRVATEKVDALIDLVGEIVIAQSMVRQLLQTYIESTDPALQNAVAALENNTQDLQARVMAIRMVPVSTVFARFPRIVRDLSGLLGKSATVEIEGGETELDKGVVERLSDPLTHLVRNAIDHGLETAAERVAQGKPAQGRVRLAAQHMAGGIVIEVTDDGRGLSTSRIRARAEAIGLLRPGEPTSDEQLHNFIFEPGFSTAETVSDISGRGVGMDVVKRAIDSLNGSIAISSQPQEGTTFRIKLPVTLAILDGLTLGVGKQIFIIPLLSVSESLRPTEKEYKRVVGQGEVIIVRGRTLPLVRLHERFAIQDAEQNVTRGLVVVAETDVGRVAILVDALLGQSQVVLKSLESHYQRIDGILGATILGDGRVSLILDIPGLVRANARNASSRRVEAA